MCYNCGCFIPHDDMGDPENITESTLTKLAEKRHLSLNELKKDLFHKLSKEQELETDYQRIFVEASKAWGQPVDEAKKETKKLLAHQLRS